MSENIGSLLSQGTKSCSGIMPGKNYLILQKHKEKFYFKMVLLATGAETSYMGNPCSLLPLQLPSRLLSSRVWYLTSEALLWVCSRAQQLPWQPEASGSLNNCRGKTVVVLVVETGCLCPAIFCLYAFLNPCFPLKPPGGEVFGCLISYPTTPCNWPVSGWAGR